jgi:hypothetical protein
MINLMPSYFGLLYLLGENGRHNIARMRLMEASVYFEKVILSHFEVFYLQGAPETIQERLVQIPAGYIEAYKQFTRQGSRVLALAYKLLPDMAVSFSLFHMKNCANHLRIFMTVEKQCVS